MKFLLQNLFQTEQLANREKRGEAVNMKVAGSYTKDLGCVETLGFVTTVFKGYKIRMDCLYICQNTKGIIRVRGVVLFS